MHGVTTVFFEDLWSRNFLNIFASPLTIWEYLSGLVLTTIATSAVGLAVMVVLAAAAFGLTFFTYGLVVLPFLLVLFLFGIALGVFGTAVVLRLGPASEWFIWPVPALLSPFVGVFYPIAVLPHWMQYLARVLPPSYVFESLRGIVKGGSASLAGLWLSGALALLYIVLACAFFARIYRQAVRTGLLARYSAESVG
jgi:ABC-2 type transport system permease protein